MEQRIWNLETAALGAEDRHVTTTVDHALAAYLDTVAERQVDSVDVTQVMWILDSTDGGLFSIGMPDPAYLEDSTAFI